MKTHRQLKLVFSLFLCCALVFTLGLMTGCKGSDGATGPAGQNGQDLTATAKPESCAICHSGAGSDHQARYNQKYQDGVILVSNLSYTNDGTNDIVTYELTKFGANFDCTQADSFGIYFTQWDGATFPYDQSLKGTVTYNAATNVCTSTKAQNATMGDLSQYDGLIVLYGTDEIVESVGHISMGKYPFAAYIETRGAVNYTSTANVTGCERCHTKPFLKHAYIYGAVNGDHSKDFWTCKACHYDNRTGGHAAWQLLVDDPAAYALQSGVTNTAQNLKYAYKARLMNDVHMSHAMEFAYPQSMANCATCHAGKLTSILTDANFKPEVCRSCHPITAAPDGETQANRAPALRTLMTRTTASGINPTATHGNLVDNLYADGTLSTDCNICHKNSNTSGPPGFNKVHTGYNTLIYTADGTGTKYADAITASIDSITMSGNVLDIKFSVNDSLSTGFTVTPTVQVSFYGYNTKDFILSNHTADANKNRIEKTIGTPNALFTEVDGTGPSWEVTLDMAAYAKTPSIPEMIAAGTIKRAEIAVLPAMGHPTLKDAKGNPLALGLNAPSRTFDLVAKAFDDNYYSPIVDANKCNNCHDQLATTFHSGNRGGNVVVCRMCHVPTSGGSHLEMQSRSIDSYVHAIHSFQPFDVKSINFKDPVQKLRYDLHIEEIFPTFDIQNCEACHYPGTYNVPDNSKSLPGILSSSATNTTWTDSNIIRTDVNNPAVPSYVTGPAARACGGCHRAEFINEDDANMLEAFYEHTANGGYMLENTTGLLDTVIDTIMSIFN